MTYWEEEHISEFNDTYKGTYHTTKIELENDPMIIIGPIPSSI